MAEQKENLQFLVCKQCAGAGDFEDKKCKICQGKGTVAYLDNHFLYWGRKISLQYLELYRIEHWLNMLTYAILFGLAFLGVLSLAYSLYLVDFQAPIIFTRYFWVDITNLYHLFFWLTVLSDFYLVYYSSLAKDKRQKVLLKRYKSDLEKTPPPVIDWLDFSKISHKYKLDIAKAFNNEALISLNKAYEMASRFKAAEVLPIHLFVGCLLTSQQVQSTFFRLGLDLNDLSAKLGRVISVLPQLPGEPVFNAQALKILLKAYRLAYENKMEEVGAVDIIYEAVKVDEKLQDIFLDLGINLEQIANVIVWNRIRNMLYKQWTVYRSNSRLKSKTGIDRAMTALQTPYLNRFSEDLTYLAKMAYLDLCIDRDTEFSEMFRILEGSATKGLILVGEPGVGKTAIIEGLAQKMIADDVPEFLRDKRLVSLSVAQLVAGASASEVQERLLICLNELVRARNVILYIDKVQELMGISAGGPESVDVSAVLNEILSKNLFILITSTDKLSYARYVENSGLGQALKKVEIPEPDFNTAIQILEGKVGQLENKNKIYFSYHALEQAVKLTDRFIHDKFLPYKAFILLEEVAVYVRKNKGVDAIVTGNDVADLISEKIKMPVADITETESKKLLNLEKIIHERIVDQEEAVSAVANSLRRARAEMRDIDRPIVNLLFLGPTGVGKTELAKTMAAVYFGSEKNMVRLDMSEYQDKTSLNRLIGAPPGYEGAGQGGVLTEAVRQQPYCIVLLDELEKAHPDILNLFLQVMEDGRLTDSTGRTIDFTNVILIATSNAQTAYIEENVKAGVPLEDIKKALLETELKQYFRPEFLNRFDNIVVFKPLSYEDVVKITGIMLNDVAKNLEKKGINFQATPAAIAELAQVGFDPQFGARPLRRAIQDRVDNALANYLLKGKIGRRDMAILDKGGIIIIDKASEL